MDNEMATPVKCWPRYAEWARMDAVANAIKSINCIKLAMAHITDAETLRHLHEASEACYEIRLSLNQIKSEVIIENDIDRPKY